jgi:hypothetical protein
MRQGRRRGRPGRTCRPRPAPAGRRHRARRRGGLRACVGRPRRDRPGGHRAPAVAVLARHRHAAGRGRRAAGPDGAHAPFAAARTAGQPADRQQPAPGLRPGSVRRRAPHERHRPPLAAHHPPRACRPPHRRDRAVRHRRAPGHGPARRGRQCREWHACHAGPHREEAGRPGDHTGAVDPRDPARARRPTCWSKDATSPSASPSRTSCTWPPRCSSRRARGS